MAASESNHICSVPFCFNRKKKHPYLSFHNFPSDTRLRRKWVWSIKKDKSVVFRVKKGASLVCSVHFEEDEFVVHPESGRKYLKPNAVLSRFPWNNWGGDKLGQAQKAEQTGPVVENTVDGEQRNDAAVMMQDHDYDWRPAPGALDEALAKIQKLEEQVSSLLFGSLLDRWCVSDEDFKYFTRFSSKHAFDVFWRSVEPSSPRSVAWCKAHVIGVTESRSEETEAVRPGSRLSCELQLIDQFFMFCLCVASGLKERILAEIFGVSTSIVNRVLITWSNYLYFVLGSVQIWMSLQQVRQTLPVQFRRSCKDVRVVVGSTTIRSESTEANFSGAVSTYKSYNTFKALIGVAPCGAITFVSKLFSDSISDRESTSQSGILELLEPWDRVVAEKGLLNEKLLEHIKVSLVVPPSKDQRQLTKDVSEGNRAIFRLYGLVDWAIRQIKEYHIWDSPVPHTLAGSVNQIWFCCCMMTNYQCSLEL